MRAESRVNETKVEKMSELIKTPIGRVLFGSPTTQDEYGKYSMGVEFDAETARPIIQQLEEMQKAFLMLNKTLKPAPVFRYAKDDDGNEIKDRIVLVFKSGFPAKVYDSHNIEVKTPLNIGKDSQVKIIFKPQPQEAKGEAHVSRYIQAVKVLKYVERSSGYFNDDDTIGDYVAQMDTFADNFDENNVV